MNRREELAFAAQQLSAYDILIVFSRQRGNADKPHGRAGERSGYLHRIGCVHTETAAPCVAVEARSTQRALTVGIPF